MKTFSTLFWSREFANFRMAAFARRELISVKDLQGLLPENSFRAFLHCTEMENFLQILQKQDFNIFNQEVQSQHYFKVYFRMRKAAKNERFLTDLMD